MKSPFLIRLLATLICVFLGFGEIISQISEDGFPVSFEKKMQWDLEKSPTLKMEPVDMVAIQAEDLEDELSGLPTRFGYPIDVNIGMKDGKWFDLGEQGMLWQLVIEAPGATSINLNYSNYDLPSGGRFFVYNPETKHYLGAFTEKNEHPTSNFATGIIYGDRVVLEYSQPKGTKGQPNIVINQVIHGYRPMSDFVKAFGTSGSCNNNVKCPEGVGWENQAKSVAMILLSNNTRWCTGALVNNANQDCKPYFLTANHCLTGESPGNPISWIFMFNYDSPTCANVDGPTNQTVQGGILRAAANASDFALIELNNNPGDFYDVYYSGWSNTNTAAPTSVAIHHPDGDVKKISFENNPNTSTSYSSNAVNANGTHWRVVDWDDGTTEGGSSGSPLFDSNKRIIGQLHGGGAACGNNLSDWYGKIWYSWSQNGNAATQRLQNWLDPANTGVTFINGAPVGCNINPTCTDGIQNGNETGVDCGGPTCPTCPTCTDGIQNGNETGIDCGGTACPTCPLCGPGSIVLESEDFTSCGMPSGWSTSHTTASANNVGPCQDGAATTPFSFDCVGQYPFSNSNSWAGPAAGFSGCLAVIDDDDTGAGGPTGAACILTPIYNTSTFVSGTLSFDYQSETSAQGEGKALVDVFNGTTWVNVLTLLNDANGNSVINLTPYLNSQLQVRFCYDDENSWAWGMAIDNVDICGVDASNCPTTDLLFDTGLPAPNGDFANGDVHDFETDADIIGENVIGVGADITYDAAGKVELLPGFHADCGATFQAFIDGCAGAKNSTELNENNSVKESVPEKSDK